MSAIQATAVGIRLFAVWLGIYVLGVVSGILSLPAAGGSKILFAALFVAIAVVVILGLWIFPLVLARRLIPGSTADAVAATPADTWLAVGCALLGLWVLSAALPKVVGDLLIMRFYSSDSDTTLVRRGLIYSCLELVIAAWLIFGAMGFRRLFWWARYAGYN